MRSITWMGMLAVSVVFLAASSAEAVDIDLNDFFADPTVTVASDGSSADIEEDASITPVILSNDPGLGDPEVIIAGAGQSLVFSYDFDEPSGNDDEFGVFIIDADTGLSAGAAYEFFTDATGSGKVEFDLTALVGDTLGLQFQLFANFGDGDLDSIVTVSDVRIIPEPGTWALLAAGLGMMALGSRRALRRKKRSA